VTYKGQTRPLVRESAPQRQDNKFQKQTLGKEANLAKRPQSGLDTKTVSREVTLTLILQYGPGTDSASNRNEYEEPFGE
jgi:hypothetical protein